MNLDPGPYQPFVPPPNLRTLRRVLGIGERRLMPSIEARLLSIEDYAEGFRVVLDVRIDEAHPMSLQQRRFYAEEHAAIAGAKNLDEMRAIAEARDASVRTGKRHPPPRPALSLNARDDAGTAYRCCIGSWSFRPEPVGELRTEMLFEPALPDSPNRLILELAAIEWWANPMDMYHRQDPATEPVHRDRGAEPFVIPV